MTAERLDQAMVARGLSRSRSQAREAILRGAVRIDGVAATRPGQRADAAARIEIIGERYVSRSAHKLAAALDHFAIDPAGALALDLGASTGGFTEVLLRRGAARVVALDVGHGQLAPALADDPRVMAVDGVNARHLAATDLPFAPDLVVADMSFISLTLALPPALAAAASTAHVVALVKPQFEVGPAHVGKGGVVRDTAMAAAAVERVGRTLAAAGFRVAPAIPSPIAGADGNREWLTAGSRG